MASYSLAPMESSKGDPPPEVWAVKVIPIRDYKSLSAVWHYLEHDWQVEKLIHQSVGGAKDYDKVVMVWKLDLEYGGWVPYRFGMPCILEVEPSGPTSA